MNEKYTLTIVKIGGKIINDEPRLKKFLNDFVKISSPKILVHGGGKSATTLAERLNIAQTMIQGRRVTDAETLKITTMVYAGWINKNITACLNAAGCSALGLCGADGYIVRSVKREDSYTDYGYVGDPDVNGIDILKIQSLLLLFDTLVIAPITSDQKGQLLNTNADTIASALSKALSDVFKARLIYCFEMNGVMLENQVMETITKDQFVKMKLAGTVHSGMIPKLENAFNAFEYGSEVVIGNAENINEIINFQNGNGTLLC